MARKLHGVGTYHRSPRVRERSPADFSEDVDHRGLQHARIINVFVKPRPRYIQWLQWSHCSELAGEHYMGNAERERGVL